MNTQDQLRETFSRLVPEAPDTIVEPGVVEARGRAVRRRRKASAVLAAAAVLAAVLIPLSLRNGPAQTPGAATASPAAPDPFGMDPCPDITLTDYATGPLPTTLDSVRLCDVGTDSTLVAPSPRDALVTGLSDFLVDLTDLPDGDPSACMAITPAPPSSVMVFTATDGSRAMVPVMACALADVSGSQKDASAIHRVLVGRLAGQRGRLAKPETGFANSDLCAWSATDIGLDPAIETITDATVCGPGAARRPLDGEQLEAVRQGWLEALPGPVHESGCADGSAGRLAALTDYGDVITFTADSCDGGFVQSGSTTSEPWHLALDAATLTRPPD